MSGSLTRIYDNVSYALSLHARAITELQEQSATGNRVNRASDSPSQAYRILGLHTQDRSLTGYTENIKDLMSTLEISSTIIEDMAQMAADPLTQKWWKETDPCQFAVKHRAEGEWWASMEEVFHTP